MDEQTSVTQLVQELGRRCQYRASESQLLELFQKKVIDVAQWNGLVRRKRIELPSHTSGLHETLAQDDLVILTNDGKSLLAWAAKQEIASV